MWAGPAQINGPGATQGKGGPKWWGQPRPRSFFSLWWAEPGPCIWSGPNQVRPTSHVNYFCRNVNSYCWCSACNQTIAEVVDGRSEVGGNLAEEKKLLSLAWHEVAGGSGGLSRLWWLQLEEEEKEIRREERKAGRRREERVTVAV